MSQKGGGGRGACWFVVVGLLGASNVRLLSFFVSLPLPWVGRQKMSHCRKAMDAIANLRVLSPKQESVQQAWLEPHQLLFFFFFLLLLFFFFFCFFFFFFLFFVSFSREWSGQACK